MNGAAGNGLYLARHFQNAYVTRDVDVAAEFFSTRYGIKSFQFMRDIPFGPEATIHIALAWAGEVMVELIQPDGSAANLYSTMLPPDGERLRFHHLGHLIDDAAQWKQVSADAARCGLPIALQGSSYGLNYLYLDARAELGHYLEYVHLDPAAAGFFQAVPRH